MGAQGKPAGARLTSTGGRNFQPGQNFWEFNPRDIAGINPLQRRAAVGMGQVAGAGQPWMNQANNWLGQLAGGGSGYMDRAIGAAGGRIADPAAFREAQSYGGQMRDVSQRQVTGANLAKDPALRAAETRFEAARMPMIQNMAAQAGLGRSNTMVNAASLAKSNEMLPMIQDSLAREERGIGREMGALESSMGNAMQRGGARMNADMSTREGLIRSLMGAAGQESANLGAAAQGSAGLGQQAWQQGMGSAAQAFDMGNQLRGIEQEQMNAPYDEQMRLYSEALNSMYGPLGMLGSMLGGTATTSQRKK